MNRVFLLLKLIIQNLKYGKKGKKLRIKKPMLVRGKRNMFFGDNVRFLNNARIETIESWGKQKFTPKLCIGSNTTFEQNCHIVACDQLNIGNNCVFSAYVYISDCNHIYSIDNHIMNNPLDVKKTTIGYNCFVGIGVKILPGVSIGNYCIIGAGSIVTKSFPSYSMIAGNPAKLIKKYDIISKKWVRVSE